MVTARVSSPVVIAERLSPQHWFPHVSGLKDSVIMLAVRGVVFVVVPSRVAGGWVTAILLSARPIVSIDVTSRVAVVGDRSIAAGVGNGSNKRHQTDWVSEELRHNADGAEASYEVSSTELTRGHRFIVSANGGPP